MAYGFCKGLLHGAVISVVGLAGLSLLAPVPEEGKTVTPEAVMPADEPVIPNEAAEKQSDMAQDDVEAIVSAPNEISQNEISAPVQDQPTDSNETPQGPQAATVDLPVGSEFGRGGDVVPHMPAPMVSDTQSRQTDAPAVSAPVEEPAPVAITDPGTQPATDLPDTSLTGTQEPQQIEDMPKTDLPIVLEVPRVMEAPEMIGGAEPDHVPTVVPTVAGEGEQIIPKEVIVTPVEREEPDSSSVSPSLPNPGLDLSMPPDLSDLRVLE